MTSGSEKPKSMNAHEKRNLTLWYMVPSGSCFIQDGIVMLCYWKSLAYSSSKWNFFLLAYKRKTNIWWSKVFNKINLQLFFKRELFKKVRNVLFFFFSKQQIRLYANVVSWKLYEKIASKCPLLCQLPFRICPLGHLFRWFFFLSFSFCRFCCVEQWKVSKREWWRLMNDVHEHQKVY